MALRYLVRGGNPLNGTIRPAGNKNAALPILAATLLAEGPSTLENIPRIRDVLTLLDLLEDLGCSVEWLERNTVRVDTGTAQPKPLDPKLCARIRASILLAGPMLARFGRVTLPKIIAHPIQVSGTDGHFHLAANVGGGGPTGPTHPRESAGAKTKTPGGGAGGKRDKKKKNGGDKKKRKKKNSRISS